MEQNDFMSHSKNFLEMAISSDRIGILENPDAYGKNSGDCGDTIEIFLMAKHDRIEKLKFITSGCINTHACANAAAIMAEGKTLSEAWEISPGHLIDFLQTLPRSSHHCAELAAGALYRALRNLHDINQNPWKKLYEKNKP